MRDLEHSGMEAEHSGMEASFLCNNEQSLEPSMHWIRYEGGGRSDHADSATTLFRSDARITAEN